MWVKLWILEGTTAALIALALTYVVLEPAPSFLGYAVLLGWAGMMGALGILVQGFRSVRKPAAHQDRSGRKITYEVAITRWGGIHTALAIAVTVIVAFHGILFFGGLLAFSAPIWIGAFAFMLLIILNISGVVTESRRKSRAFGSLKTVHVLLMLTVVVLSAIHIEVLLGPDFMRAIAAGVIVTAVVVVVVFVSVPLITRTDSLA